MENAPTTPKPQKIRAPSHMHRHEKAHFRRIIQRLTAAEVVPNEAQVPLIEDLMSAEARIAKLDILLTRATARGIDKTVTAEVLSINSQINATTALAHRIEGRLGL